MRCEQVYKVKSNESCQVYKVEDEEEDPLVLNDVDVGAAARTQARLLN